MFLTKKSIKAVVFFKLLLALSVGLSSAFAANNKAKLNVTEAYEIDSLEHLLAKIRKEYTPDVRDNYLGYQIKDGNLIIESTLAKALEVSKKELLMKGYVGQIETKLLPDATTLNGFTYALANVSVTTNRIGTKNASEVMTQMLLGMPMDVLTQKSGYCLVRTPDGYLSWVTKGTIKLLTEQQFKEWKSSNRLIYTNLYGRSYQAPSAGSLPVSDLVQGNILKITGEEGNYYAVEYPDGRKAFVLKSEAQQMSKWMGGEAVKAENILAFGHQLMGTPYLWGGTSVKAMDCSGFTKTCFFNNGYIVPRDASQQVQAGDEVDIYENGSTSLKKCLANLKPADLLFFGPNKDKITHVAFYIGDGKFIHESGMVKINSLKPGTEDYDEGHAIDLVKARRFINAKNNNQIIPISKSNYYTNN